MKFSYQSDIELGEIGLYVKDLANMTAFYRDMIGLTCLSNDEDEVALGLSGADQVLLRLIKGNERSQPSYGLYHMALLLPERSDLGSVFKHLLTKGYPLTGGADHGYSEALYLEDPEGNGIEIYWDRPQADWDIREDGRIIGVTEELDAMGLLTLAEEATDFSLPAGPCMGHVHLSVKDAKASADLYRKVFPITEKFALPSASWLASGDYHHHLAFNQWAGTHLSMHQDRQPGLAYLTISFTDALLFQASLKKASLYGMTVLKAGEDSALIEDGDGIRTWLRLK